MLTLHDTQAAFRRALLADEPEAIAALIAEDGLAAEERIAVYRNNVFSSLTAALRDTFPAVCRLVDERFFAYAAHEFIRAHPPERACLSDYGGRFADFLAAFPPCRDLVYLPDVARLEWLMNVAAHAPDAAPLAPSLLTAIAPEDAPRLVLQLQLAHGLIVSPWPIDRIWRANRPGAAGEETIDLAAGGVQLEIARIDEDVMLRTLDAAVFAFRHAIARSATLAVAIEAALAAEPRFDPAMALADLFREGIVIGAALAAPDQETTS
jgi:hypothetical protein